MAIDREAIAYQAIEELITLNDCSKLYTLHSVRPNKEVMNFLHGQNITLQLLLRRLKELQFMKDMQGDEICVLPVTICSAHRDLNQVSAYINFKDNTIMAKHDLPTDYVVLDFPYTDSMRRVMTHYKGQSYYIYNGRYTVHDSLLTPIIFDLHQDEDEYQHMLLYRPTNILSKNWYVRPAAEFDQTVGPGKTRFQYGYPQTGRIS